MPLVLLTSSSLETEKTKDTELYYDYIFSTKASMVNKDFLGAINQLTSSVSLRLLLQVIIHQCIRLLHHFSSYRPIGQRQNVGVLKVYIDKKSTLKVVLTATVTFVDMISNIGGIMGLFCGISFLSLAEIAYWMAKLITKQNL